MRAGTPQRRTAPETPPPATSNARACFLCGAREGPAVFRERWPVTGLGYVEIGYRICGSCGAVRQDPALAPDAMSFLYGTLSNYTNPGRAGRPGPRKVQAVARQLAHLRTACAAGRGARGHALQVGSSDGYTLAALRDAGWRVQGLDPSAAAARLAATLWQVPTRVSAFEQFEPAEGERWDCVVMTHVLEHLYDPVAALARAFRLLTPSGRVLIEVPCLVRPECWPPGFFTLEHVNYFSAETLAAAVARAGGALASGPELDPDVDAYPVVRCTARPVADPPCAPLPPPDVVRAQVGAYLQREARSWRRVDDRLRAALADGAPVAVYGAGIHTSQLFARTRLGDCDRVRAILDSDPQKWGVRFGRWQVAGPDWLAAGHGTDCTVVISSYQAETEIRTALEPLRDRMRSLVTLYESASA